jgi:hypothetical protein
MGLKFSAFAPQPPNLGGSESLTVPQNGGCRGRVQDVADSCKRSRKARSPQIPIP